MKVLVLSCSTGEGHNSAAKAIIEALSKKNIEGMLIDALSFGTKENEKIIKSFFNGVAVNNPSIFGLLYKAGSVVSNPDLKSPIYFANIVYANNLGEYINDNNIDVVISTHLFPMEALTYLKNKNKINSKCYAILTDYTAIPFIEETNMDGYFIPSKKLAKEFTDKKIPRNKVYPYGIPVLSKYNKKYDITYCKKKLKLPTNKKIVLIMTGGVGCGNIEKMIDPLLKKTSDDVLFIVLTGKNKELQLMIENNYNNTKVMGVPFTDKVELYMDASSLLLTKPGGLSTTEAAVKNIPFIHTFPIPGCETINAKFFSTNNMSLQINNYEQLVEAVLKLLNDKKLINKLLTNQKKYINSNAASDIVNRIITK